MNFVSMGVNNSLEGPNSGHYHQTLIPSPRAQRRHTIIDHNLLPPISSKGRTLSQRSVFNDIQMSDLVKIRLGHSRNASNVTNADISLASYKTQGKDNNNISEVGDHFVPLITDKCYLHVEEEQDRASSYGETLMEELPLDHNCDFEGCQRAIINVSGLKFETQIRTLERLPNTLLGNPQKRARFWDESRQEFFFDRHRPSFQAILYFYQSGGRLKKPLEVPMDIFLNEVHFYELGGHIVDAFKKNEGYIVENVEFEAPSSNWKRTIYEILEYPESSWPAKIFACSSIFFILISVVTFCVETLPQFKDSGCINTTVPTGNGSYVSVLTVNWTDPLFIIESCCIAFFVFELVMRLLVCPSKYLFFRTTINWIDLLSITPYFIFLALNSASGSCGGNHSGSVLSVLRVLRVVRILKLSKHSQGLKILGKTLKTSIRELSMFILFLGIATVIYSGAIFYAEMGQEKSMFVSIPDAFWWAIVTMTTVGYGDYVPVGPLGKILGGLCVLSGVLAIALPVPVIVANFNNYYRHYTGRGVRILL